MPSERAAPSSLECDEPRVINELGVQASRYRARVVLGCQQIVGFPVRFAQLGSSAVQL